MSRDQARTTQETSRGGCSVSLVIAAAILGFFSLGIGIVAIAAWTYFSLPLGEDSWRHCVGGGMFVTDAPDLSADGTEIVFASPKSGHGDVYLYDQGDNQARRVTESADCELSPRFRPGHEQVLFEREHDQRRHVWILDIATGKARQLTQGDVLDDLTDVSLNGKYALVARSQLTRGMGRHVSPHLLEIETGVFTDFPDNFFSVSFADRARR